MIENYLTSNSLFAYLKRIILKRKSKMTVIHFREYGVSMPEPVDCSWVRASAELAVFFHSEQVAPLLALGFPQGSHSSGCGTRVGRLWYSRLFAMLASSGGLSGSADGGQSLVLGSELEQSAPPEMSRGGWNQRPRRPEFLECTKDELGKLWSLAKAEGQES